MARMNAGSDADKLSDRFLELAARIGKVVNAIPKSRLGNHIAGQLVRCGTSPAPNYEEARAAESRNDFIHKLRIVLKELRETRCWLRLLAHAEIMSQTRLRSLIDEVEQLGKIIGQSIVTAQRNTKGRATDKKPRSN
jgi:four helix bundle protein